MNYPSRRRSRTKHNAKALEIEHSNAKLPSLAVGEEGEVGAGGRRKGFRLRLRDRDWEWRKKSNRRGLKQSKQSQNPRNSSAFYTEQKTRLNHGSSGSHESSGSSEFGRFWPVQCSKRFSSLTGSLSRPGPGRTGRTGRSGPVLVTLIRVTMTHKPQICTSLLTLSKVLS